MAKDMKTGVGFIIPAAGVVGFFTSLFLGEHLISIIVAVLGILAWFAYMLVMESHVPREMGNMIILFGVLLSLGIFSGFGIKQNIWGGMELEPEGAIFSLIILFFAILSGLNFRNQQAAASITPAQENRLSDEDRKLVVDAINSAEENRNSFDKNEPKIIVLNQESQNTEEKKSEDKSLDSDQTKVNDPYGLTHNPYFAYPPEYYYDDEEDDEYEEDGEYEEDWEEDWEEEEQQK